MLCVPSICRFISVEILSNCFFYNLAFALNILYVCTERIHVRGSTRYTKYSHENRKESYTIAFGTFESSEDEAKSYYTSVSRSFIIYTYFRCFGSRRIEQLRLENFTILMHAGH